MTEKEWYYKTFEDQNILVLEMLPSNYKEGKK